MADSDLLNNMGQDVRLDFDRGTLLLSGVEREIDQFLQTKWWQWDNRVNGWRCEAMYYSRVIGQLKTLFENDFRTTIPPFPRVFHSSTPSIPPGTISRALETFSDNRWRGQIIVPDMEERIPLVIGAMTSWPCSTLLVTTSSERAQIWCDQFRDRLGCNCGVIDNRCQLQHPVSATTYNTARRWMSEIGIRFEMLIFDDAHLLGDGPWVDAASLSIAPRRLGLLSGTERTDGATSLSEHLCGPVIFRIDPNTHTDQGNTVLVPVDLAEAERDQYTECYNRYSKYIADIKAHSPRYTIGDLRRDNGADSGVRQIQKALATAEKIIDSSQAKLLKIGDILSSSQVTAILTQQDRTAMQISAMYRIPAITHATPTSEKNRILHGIRNGQFTAFASSSNPNNYPHDLSVQNVVSLYPVKRFTKNVSRWFQIYCKETVEDPGMGKIWRYDAYRRRIGH